jgi:transcriptional regulator with XRE-family HTH domain
MAKPPTLGDRLADRMEASGHTHRDAAEALDASPADVERWAGDLEAPGPDRLAGIAGYLEVDTAEVNRLVLRSQMRRVQRDIRDGPAPTRAAS